MRRPTDARLIEALYEELVELVDAAFSDQFIAVTIDARLRGIAAGSFDGDDYVLEPLVVRVVAELDEEDLAALVRQETPFLLRHPLAAGGTWLARRIDLSVYEDAPVTLADQVRATVERYLMSALRRHLRDRAAVFAPSQEVQAA